jgi:hypothetical protein
VKLAGPIVPKSRRGGGGGDAPPPPPRTRKPSSDGETAPPVPRRVSPSKFDFHSDHIFASNISDDEDDDAGYEDPDALYEDPEKSNYEVGCDAACCPCAVGGDGVRTMLSMCSVCVRGEGGGVR